MGHHPDLGSAFSLVSMFLSVCTVCKSCGMQEDITGQLSSRPLPQWVLESKRFAWQASFPTEQSQQPTQAS